MFSHASCFLIKCQIVNIQIASLMLKDYRRDCELINLNKFLCSSSNLSSRTFFLKDFVNMPESSWIRTRPIFIMRSLNHLKYGAH